MAAARTRATRSMRAEITVRPRCALRAATPPGRCVQHEGSAYTNATVGQSGPIDEQAQSWRGDIENHDTHPHQFGRTVVCVDRPAATSTP